MFWLIVFSPAIVCFSIVGFSELGILGVSPKTFSWLIDVTVALQAIFFFGGVTYEAIFRRQLLKKQVPRYIYYIIFAAVLSLGLLAAMSLLM